MEACKFNDDQIKTIIQDTLRGKKPMSVKDIVRDQKSNLDMRIYKPRFNRNLYLMEKNGVVLREDSTPPLWSLVNNSVEEPVNTGNNTRKNTTHVFIDVDNSPCLDKAAGYAKDDCYVYAYASPAYNHHKPKSTQNLEYYQLTSDEDLPSAADVRFGMKMSELCLTASPGDAETMFFLVVSKDKILHTMVKMHEAVYGFNYIIVQNGWDGLREHLE